MGRLGWLGVWAGCLVACGGTQRSNSGLSAASAAGDAGVAVSTSGGSTQDAGASPPVTTNPDAGTSVRWVHLAATPYLRVAAPFNGDGLAAVQQTGLDVLTSAGAVAFTASPDGADFFSVATSADGAFAYVSGFDGQHPGPPPSEVLQYSGSNTATQVKVGSDQCSATVEATFDGTELYISGCEGGTSLEYGREATWSYTPAYETMTLLGARFDSSGNVIAVGSTYGVFTYGDATFGADGRYSTVILKFDASGHLLWAHDLLPDNGNAHPAGLGIGADGTVYVAGSFDGVAHWAAGTYDSANGGSFVLTLDASGTSKWLRQTATFTPNDRHLGDFSFALTASGVAYVVGSAGDCAHGIHVEAFDTSGSPVGKQLLACDGEGTLIVDGAAALGSELLVAGGYSGATSFSDGTTTAAGTNGGFVLELAAQ